MNIFFFSTCCSKIFYFVITDIQSSNVSVKLSTSKETSNLGFLEEKLSRPDITNEFEPASTFKPFLLIYSQFKSGSFESLSFFKVFIPFIVTRSVQNASAKNIKFFFSFLLLEMEVKTSKLGAANNYLSFSKLSRKPKKTSVFLKSIQYLRVLENLFQLCQQECLFSFEIV